MNDSKDSAAFVTTSSELAACCEQLSRSDALALDTEFVRTNTFYPRPGLFQLADSQSIFLIDPIAIEDLTPLAELIAQNHITWVMHACSEDLVLLLSRFNRLPQNVFDTQIAAAYMGLGFSLSYQALVSDVLNVDVDKGETRSDWLQRPLTNSQLHYAASDVEHLLALYKVCTNQLNLSSMLGCLEEDMRVLIEGVKEAENAEAWRSYFADISNAWRLSDQELNMLQALCVWRENKSRSRNKPRNWIAKDNELFAIAQYVATESLDELNELPSIDGVAKPITRKYGNELLELLAETNENEPVDRNLLNPPLHPKHRDTLKLWRKIVTGKAEQLNIAPELLARKRWLLDLVKGLEQAGELVWQAPMDGWRRQALESEFQDSLKSLRL